MKRKGAKVALLSRAPRWTRHAPDTLSLIGLDAQGVPSYSSHGEGCADRLLTLDALAARCLGVNSLGCCATG